MSASHVHPTAVVASGAQLAAGVTVGPYTVIGPQVRVGAETVIGSQVVIDGRTTIGERNQIFQFAAIGAAPQDLKYRGEESELIIGHGNRIREFCTLHPGTTGGGLTTRIGDGNLLMNFSHIAHDCQLGDGNIIANGAQLGGHVCIEGHVVVGALVGIHQFVKIGESAIVGAGSMVSLDVPPYCNATGDRARLRGINTVGLKRRGFSPTVVAAIKRAYRTMFQLGLKAAEAIVCVREEQSDIAEVEHFVAFIETSERGVCR